MRSTVASRKSRSCETHSSVPVETRRATPPATDARRRRGGWWARRAAARSDRPSNTDASRQRAASPPDQLAQPRAPVEVIDAPVSRERLVQPGFQRPAAEQPRTAPGPRRRRPGPRESRSCAVELRAGPPTPPPVLVARGRRWWALGPGHPAAGSRRGRRHPTATAPRSGRQQHRPTERRSVVLPMPLAADEPGAPAVIKSVSVRPSNRGVRVRWVPSSMVVLSDEDPFLRARADERGVEPTPRHRTSGPGFGTDEKIQVRWLATSRTSRVGPSLDGHKGGSRTSAGVDLGRRRLARAGGARPRARRSRVARGPVRGRAGPGTRGRARRARGRAAAVRRPRARRQSDRAASRRAVPVTPR